MIVGQMALYNHPCSTLCLQALLPHVDKVYLRQDVRGLPEPCNVGAKLHNIMMLCADKFGGMLVSATPWDATTWREEMLRSENVESQPLQLQPGRLQLVYAPFHPENYFYVDSALNSVTFEKSLAV